MIETQTPGCCFASIGSPCSYAHRETHLSARIHNLLDPQAIPRIERASTQQLAVIGISWHLLVIRHGFGYNYCAHPVGQSAISEGLRCAIANARRCSLERIVLMYDTAEFPLAYSGARSTERLRAGPPFALWHDIKRQRPRWNSDTLEGK